MLTPLLSAVACSDAYVSATRSIAVNREMIRYASATTRPLLEDLQLRNRQAKLLARIDWQDAMLVLREVDPGAAERLIVETIERLNGVRVAAEQEREREQVTATKAAQSEVDDRAADEQEEREEIVSEHAPRAALFIVAALH